MNAFVSTTTSFLSTKLQRSQHYVPRRCRPQHCSQPYASANWPALSRRARQTLSQLTETANPATYAAQLRASADADPENPFLWHALAKHLATNPDAAIDVLKQAVDIVPTGSRGGLFEFWGSILVRQGSCQQAITIFLRGLRSDPYAPLYISLANAYAAEGNIDQARETLRFATCKFPYQASLWRAWAMLEAQNGAPFDARDKFRKAVDADLRDVRAWRMLIQSESRCGASQNAIADLLRRALMSCPNDVPFRLQLAQIEENRRGVAAAKAILQFPAAESDMMTLRALAKLEAQEQNYERARRLYRKAAQLEMGKDTPQKQSPNKFRRKLKRKTTVKSLHAWALMEARIGNVDAARSILDEALGTSPTDAVIWRAIGELESRERNFDRARKAFKNAVALDPQDMRLLLAWGKTEALAGDLSRAEMLVERVARSADVKDYESDLQHPKEKGDDPDSTEESTEDPIEGDWQSQISNSGISEEYNVSSEVLADALREWAILASRDGRFKEAINFFFRACRLVPEHASGWRLLASQVLREEGIEAVRKVYEEGISKVRNDAQPKLLHWWGQDERAKGNFDEARTLFRRATSANPSYMSAWLSWGLMEKGLGKVETACEIFEEASEKAERDIVRAPFIFQAWGRVEELERGRVEVAADVFKRGINVVPRCGALWTAWGLLEERRGNLGKAREYFERATFVEPTHGSAWHSWALLEARQCNYKQASNLYQCGNELDPTNSSLLASWAMMEGKELGKTERGRDLFERATAADPLYSPAWHSWGCLEMNVGNYEKARQLFLKSASLRSDDPSPLHTLGVLEAEHCNNNNAAIENWRKAISMMPGHALSYQSWALLEGRSRGNLNEARKLFREGIEHEVQSKANIGLLLQSWAGLEERHGNFDQARSLLRKALDVERRRAETWLSLALLEKARGNRESARRLLEDGVEVVSPAANCAALFVAWATLEAEAGDMEYAREIFARAVRVNPSNSKTWKSYAAVEGKFGDEVRAAQIRMSGEALVEERDVLDGLVQ